MNIKNDKIEKLKIVKINKTNLMVENNLHQKGTILIRNVSHFFVSDLNKLFVEGDIIYGEFLNETNGKRYYTLKNGHSLGKNKFIKETGGGHLGIYFLLNKLEKKEKNK